MRRRNNQKQVKEEIAEIQPRLGTGKWKVVLGGISVIALGIGLSLTGVLPGIVGAQAASSSSIEVAEDIQVLELERLTVNLADKGDRHLARVGVAFVVDADVDLEAVRGRVPLFRNAVLPLLMKRTAEQMKSAEAFEELRISLTTASEKIYPKSDVRKVLITELIVQ